jgi:acyl-homoserine-lactone acylase
MDEKAIAIPWDEKDPFQTPRGLKDPQAAVKLLKEAVTETKQNFGKIDIAYGEINRFRINGNNLGGNGGPGDQFGIYRTIYFVPDKDKKQLAAMGDSYVAIVEFGPLVKAKVSLSYGNATQPRTRHLGDQLGLMSRKQLRPALLDRKEIMDNLEEREEIKMK